MSNYKGHLVGGAVTYAIVCYVLKDLNPSPLTLLEWLMCALMGSLFPDIDIKSKGQKYFYTFVFIGFIVLLLQQKLIALGCLSILCLTPLLVPHRGLFHHVGFILAMPIFLWAVASLIKPCYKVVLFYDMIFFVAGQLSHVWLDMGIERMVYQIVGHPKRRAQLPTKRKKK